MRWIAASISARFSAEPSIRVTPAAKASLAGARKQIAGTGTH